MYRIRRVLLDLSLCVPLLAEKSDRFIAGIYWLDRLYIKKQMQVKGLFKDYTLPGLLDKLDVIECFEQPGKSLKVGELLDKQKQLYYDLGVIPPASLWVRGNVG